jgi:hypothetical protein
LGAVQKRLEQKSGFSKKTRFFRESWKAKQAGMLLFILQAGML